MARVFLVDYGITDIVGVDRIKTIHVHKDVPGMARKVQLVTWDNEEEWKEEEVVMISCLTKYEVNANSEIPS